MDDSLFAFTTVAKLATAQVSNKRMDGMRLADSILSCLVSYCILLLRFSPH